MILLIASCTPPSVSVTCTDDDDCGDRVCVDGACVVLPQDAGVQPFIDAGSKTADAGGSVDAGTSVDAGRLDDGGPDAGPDAGVFDPIGDPFGPFVDGRFNQKARIRVLTDFDLPPGEYVVPIRLGTLTDLDVAAVSFWNETQDAKLPFELADTQDRIFWVRTHLRAFDSQNAFFVYFDYNMSAALDPPQNPWAGTLGARRA